MADIPAEKIAALAAEKLTQALQALDVEEIIQAEGKIHQALALVSLLSEPQKPKAIHVITGLDPSGKIIAAVRAADEAI